MMVLVAQMEQVGSQQRDVTSFIVDDLMQRFETDRLVANVRIREYGDVIKSTLQAGSVASQTRAPIVIWGGYDDDGTTINVQLGSVESLPGLVIDRATLEVEFMSNVFPQGYAQLFLVLANDPTLVGKSFYHQGLLLGPRTLSQDWLKMTVLP